MRRILAAAAVGALALLPVAAQADTPPGIGTFTVDGTGQAKADGVNGRIDVTITCPKGTGWFTDQSSELVFSKIGSDDADASWVPTSGKCKGKPQKESIPIRAFHGTLLRGAGSPEYALGIIFTVDGGETTVQRGGTDPATGPVIFLK